MKDRLDPDWSLIESNERLDRSDVYSLRAYVDHFNGLSIEDDAKKSWFDFIGLYTYFHKCIESLRLSDNEVRSILSDNRDKLFERLRFLEREMVHPLRQELLKA